MKQLNAYSVLIFSSFLISAKLQRVQKLIFKESNDNRSEFNEVYFHPKEYSYKIERTKPSDGVKNYINYRDVYGIRYSPQKKEISKNKSETSDNFLITTIPASIESEGISPLSSESVIMESTTFHSPKQQLDNKEDDEEEEYEANAVHNGGSNGNNNDDFKITEQDVGETNTHHIMKPNNRVEHALDFLANRMKNLMYISNDHNRIAEPNVSPHLLSLGKFLNLFSLIRVDSVPCMSGRRPLRQLYGSCLNEAECVNLGGISMDRCANGFGVCCICK